MDESQRRSPWALLAVIAIFRALPAAAGACTALDVADASIEIVPTECSFWRQAGVMKRLCNVQRSGGSFFGRF